MIAVCCGMIRSGSTLQYNLVRSVVEASGVGSGVGFVALDQLDSEQLAHWKKQKTVTVIKTHEFSEELMQAADVIFYIYRDLRDVAASASLKFSQSGAKLLNSLASAVRTGEQIENMDGVVCQKYEEVFRDIDSAIHEVESVFSLALSESDKARIRDDLSIESAKGTTIKIARSWRGVVRKALKGLGKSFDTYDSRTLLHPDHVSESGGQPGGWKTLLDPTTAKQIETLYADWLDRHGYKGEK